MSFLNPWLLFGALGVALPIIAHLFNRHKFKETDWAAMQFLNRNIRIRSRQLRLKDFLLLLIRCLAILLLVLALAQPSMSSPDGSSLIPGEKRSGVVIALDSSFSMEHSDADATRFDRAIEKVELIAENIHPGAPVSLVLLGNEHKVVIRNMAFNANKFKAILEQQKVTPESLNLDNVANSLAKLVEDMDASQKEVYIITDAQTGTWNKNSTLLNDGLKDLNKMASVMVIPVSGNSNNLAVTDLDLVSGVLRKGTIARYQATIKNCGTSPVSNVEVKCRADDVQIDSKMIPLIQPGSSETVSLFVPFHNSGPTRITAEINKDTLKADNVRRTVAIVRDRVSVLCVDGSSGDAGRLIRAALMARNGGVEDEDYIVRSVPWLSLPGEKLNDVDVIVMANVPEITEGQAKELSNFVRQGNGLVWFGGDDVKITKWNEQAKKTQLLPAEIIQVVGNSDNLGAGKPLDLTVPDHFVVRPLQSLPEDLFTETRFMNMMQVKAKDTSVPILKLAGSDSPILIEHSLGRGHVFMFTTTADATWNNMSLTPVFPMLMQKIVTYLAGREFEQPRIVGDSLSLSYTDQPDANDAVFDTPSKQIINVPVRQYRDQYIALLENASEAGFYMVKVSVQAAGMPVAVNVDTSESDVASLNETELKSNLAGTNITVASSDADLLSAIESVRTSSSSWRFFMITAILFILIECLFADRILRKQLPKQVKKDPPNPGTNQKQPILPTNLEAAGDA